MTTGIKSANVSSKTLATGILVNAVDGTGQMTLQALSNQMLGEGLIPTSGIVAQTWSQLLGMPGGYKGQGAEVLDTDAGTHGQATSTGYNGDAVANAGRFQWSDTWARWVRVGGTGLAAKVDKTTYDANVRGANFLFDSFNVYTKDFPLLGGWGWYLTGAAITWTTTSAHIPVKTPVAQVATGQFKKRWEWQRLGRRAGETITVSVLMWTTTSDGTLGIYFYNAAGDLLDSEVVSVGNTGLQVISVTTTVPAGAIARMDIVSRVLGPQEVAAICATLGTAPAVFAENNSDAGYVLDWIKASYLYGAVSADVTANEITFADVFPASKNLYNRAKATSGLLDHTGNITVNAGYYYSDYVRVTPGQTYTGSKAGVAANMRFICYYDGNKVVVAGGSSVATSGFTVPAGVYFVRFSLNTADYTAYQLEAGGAATAWVPYGRAATANAFSVSGASLQKSTVTPDKTTFLALGKNLFDKAGATIGYFWGHDHSHLVSATFDHSDLIPVTPGQQLYGRGASAGMRFTAYFDAAGNPLTGGSSTTTNTITVPAGVYFVRVTFSHVDLDSFQLEVGTVQTGYETYGYRFTPDVVVGAGGAGTSSWSGKAWASLGDSLTLAGNWQSFATAGLGLIHTNYGVGGTKISGAPGDANAMCQDTRINAIPTTIDLLTLLGGTNDWAQSVPLGTISSTDPTTFYGALNTFVGKAMARWPAKRIVLMTTPYAEFTATYADRGWAAPATNTLGLTTRDYAEAIRQVGIRYGLPVFDIAADAGWNALNISSYVTNESGNYIHPATAGARRMGGIVLGRLKNLEPA